MKGRGKSLTGWNRLDLAPPGSPPEAAASMSLSCAKIKCLQQNSALLMKMTLSISDWGTHVGEGAGWLLSGLNAHCEELKLEQFAAI